MDDEWRQYERLVLPPEAGAVQRQETRRAFHAGGHALLRQLGLIERSSSALLQQGNPYAAPAVDADELDALQAELEAFNAAVVAGLA